MLTPRIKVDLTVLKGNISLMQSAASAAGVALRPHIKAHKSTDIMKLQLKAGACGITVAKLGEAETMAMAGAGDIFVAYQVMGEEKYKRLKTLSEQVTVSVAVDNLEHCRVLASQFAPEQPLDVLIEVDTGLRRCGVLPAEVLGLAREVVKVPGIRLKGIFTHAGHAYGSTAQNIERIGLEEAQTMVNCNKTLMAAGINLEVVSTGSTPTAIHNLKVAGITEIRPGNYVFNDAIQVGLGVADESHCALTVETTVISTPAPNRVVIDAGSKVFGLDKGAHGTSVVVGFGRIIGRPDLIIERLSEEHGIIVCTGPRPALGQKLEVIPNHACVAVNLANQMWVDENTTWDISARGRVD